MKGLSVLYLIFAIDAIVGLAQGNNMYSLNPGGTTGVIINVVTLIACVIVGPALWQAAKRRDWHAAVARYEREGDDSGLHQTAHVTALRASLRTTCAAAGGGKLSVAR